MSFTDDTGKDYLEKYRTINDKTGKENKETYQVGTGLFYLDWRKNLYKTRILKTIIPGMPSPQTKKFHLIGKVFLETSSNKKSYECKDVSFAQWQTFKAGNFEFWIVESSKENNNLRVVFEVSKIDKTDRYPATLCSLSFQDEKGLKIPVSSPREDFNKVYFQRDTFKEKITALLDGNPKTANIKVDIWEDIKEVEVPINVEVGLGLEKAGEEVKTKN